MFPSSTQTKEVHIWPCTRIPGLIKSGIRLLTDVAWCCVSARFAGVGEVSGLDSSSLSSELPLEGGYCLFRFFDDGEECGWEWMDKVNE